MPANINTMMSVRLMPWHRDPGARVLDDHPGSWDEARRAGGIAWDPVSRPVFRPVETEVPAVREGDEPTTVLEYQEIPGWHRIERSDNGHVLGIDRTSRPIIDHAEMGAIVEALLRQTNIKWETCGALDQGERVWALVKLDEPIEVPGDPDGVAYAYLAVQNSHDRSGACVGRATTIRIVCANTWNAAEAQGERSGLVFRFSHRRGTKANWEAYIEEARQAIFGLRRDNTRYLELMTQLLGLRVTSAQTDAFITAFIPEPPGEVISPRVRGNIERARGAVWTILASPTTTNTAGTAYAWVQASVEYLDHIRKANSWETRFSRTLLRPDDLKRALVPMARELASV